MDKGSGQRLDQQGHDGLYIMLISVHGLIRGFDLDLGRDADTGGQTLYVVDLARALIKHPDVARVDLVTRLIRDPKVDGSYSAECEKLADGCYIIRIPCGPDRYLAKETLWPHLDSFCDNVVSYLRSTGRAPDLIHGHYADAGYVASRLSGLLDVPMAFTGHSLGRVKRQRLLDNGAKPEAIERRYRITRRIEAEETALDNASFVVTSTQQEVEQQYAIYDNYQPRRMIVIPPGVDLSRFGPPPRGWRMRGSIHKEIVAFLADGGKPAILAISRADPRKNIATLLQAFGENEPLREVANLVIVAGNRDDIREMDKAARDVLTEVLHLIDYYNLYGSAAYPKHHRPEDVPDIFRFAARTKGVFVNPALTEPFGLTLLEAAATGLPVVATQDGGPADIIARCTNGLLVDPVQWRKWSQRGIRGAHRHFSWSAHVNKYMRAARAAISQSGKRRVFYSPKSRLITADRIVVCDIDGTLIGDKAGLDKLLQLLRQAGDRAAFGVATGRNIDMTLSVLRAWKIPTPQLLITSVGSSIHYGRHVVQDRGWERNINYRWRPDALRRAMAAFDGLELQGPEGQGQYKVSYHVLPDNAPSVEEVVRHLRRSRLQAHVVYSHHAYLDLLPIRAGKGSALRDFAFRWSIPLERCLVAGDSGDDEEMLTGNTLGVVVGNHDPQLEKLRGHPQVYFAKGRHAWGVIEGIEHYDFFGAIRVPLQESTADDRGTD